MTCFKWWTKPNFHALEVVGRGSETQLQVGENLNSHTLFFTFKYCVYFLIQESWYIEGVIFFTIFTQISTKSVFC